MSLTTYNKKRLKEDESDYWIGAPQGGDGSKFSNELIKNRDKIVVYGTIDDNNASYSYDDWALIKLGDKWALLETSGCSCPSPDETWRVVYGPCDTLDKLIKEFQKAQYGMEIDQAGEFAELFEFAKGTVKKKGKR